MLGGHLVLSLCLSCWGRHIVKISWVWKKNKGVSTGWDCQALSPTFWEDTNFGTSLLLPFWMLCNSRKWCKSELLPAEEEEVGMWFWMRTVVYHPRLGHASLSAILTCVGLISIHWKKKISWIKLLVIDGRLCLIGDVMVFYNLSIPFLQCSLSLRYRGCVVGIATGDGQPIVNCFLHIDQLWISVMVSACCKQNKTKLLWWGVRDTHLQI